MAFAGTTTLTTYYPSPNGYYSKMTLLPETKETAACLSGAMYVDNTTGAVGYCVDNNINPNDGTLIGGSLSGKGTWGYFQAPTPNNFNDVANKGYVDAQTGRVTYEGVTNTVYQGNCGGPNGMYSCNAKCFSNFPGSHMCTESEIVRSGRFSPPPPGWVSCDSYSQRVDNTGSTIEICSGVSSYIISNPGPGYSADCGGWQSISANDHGPLINNGTFIAGDCDNFYRIECCK